MSNSQYVPSKRVPGGFPILRRSPFSAALLNQNCETGVEILEFPASNSGASAFFESKTKEYNQE
jgi:hypothetical protein